MSGARLEPWEPFGRLLFPIRRSARGAWQWLRGCPDEPGRAFEIAYVILPSDEVHNHVRRLQLDILRRLGVDSGLATVPHITLKLGFPAADPEPHARHLDELAREVEPFEVGVGGVGFFDEGIAFLDVERQPRLEDLRRRILRDLSDRFGIPPYPLESGEEYRFHVTLAHGLSRRNLPGLQQALDGVDAHFRFALRCLGLLCSARGGWSTYRRAALSTDPEGPSTAG